MRPARWTFTATAAVGLAVLSACSSKPVSGSLTIAGSQTMQSMISQAVAGYSAAHPMVDVRLDLVGSGASILLFCEGLADAIGTSRPMNQGERETCARAGVEPAELMVGRDAVVLATSVSSKAPACLAVEDLYALTSAENDGAVVQSGRDRTWADATELARELGSTMPYPNAAWELFITDPSSATIDTYISRIIEPIAVERGRPAALTSDRDVAASNVAVLNAVESRPAAIGIVDYSSVRSWAGTSRLIGLGRGEDCVAANDSSIASDVYPLSRSLYFYVNVREDSATVKAFADFLTSDRLMAEIASRTALELTEEERAESVAGFSAALGQEPSA